MTPSGFLYRRLSQWVPCVFQQVGTGGLSLRGKYEIASFRDVFMSSNYWRMFDHLVEPPKLIVDLGAHCGHFSVLCNICILERFGEDRANYILVEALPKLVQTIRRTISEVGLENQARIIQGVVGRKSGDAFFQRKQKNLLASKASFHKGSDSDQVLRYIDLDQVIPQHQAIDVLKIDIEGSEYDLLRNYESLFRRAKLVLIETHGPIDERVEIEQQLEKIGLVQISTAIVRASESLLILGKGDPSNDF